ncbi:hypothetical protein CC2G_002030 [Coprinopsis cinerea AmutBmut pab1-1]|nr:hypothetical protein CC2G_002030 [Coprinopsis cinerea AmutBmut pab1-1]
MLIFEYAQGLYPITTYESILLSELIYAHLACTLGPSTHTSRASTWPAEHRHIIYHILQRAFLHPGVAGSAIFLLGRLKHKRPTLQLEGLAGLNAFTASFMVASKCLSDYPLPMNRWLYITGNHFAASQLSYLETQLCCDLDWDLGLDRKVYDDFTELFAAWVVKRQMEALPVDFFSQPEFDHTTPVGFAKLNGDVEGDAVEGSELFDPLSAWREMPQPELPAASNIDPCLEAATVSGHRANTHSPDYVREIRASNCPSNLLRSSRYSRSRSRSPSRNEHHPASYRRSTKLHPTSQLWSAHSSETDSVPDPYFDETIDSESEYSNESNSCSSWVAINSPAIPPPSKNRAVQCTILDEDIDDTASPTSESAKLKKLLSRFRPRLRSTRATKSV